MLIKEYRISMPMSVTEYQIGQLYNVAEASKEATGNGEGVEVLKNEPFSNYPLFGNDFSQGQYTQKIYHLASKVPAIVRYVLPNDSLSVHEEAWNAYPYCRTVLTNPGGAGDRFKIVIESVHLNDRGITENAHHLPPDVLKDREVIVIDIANDPNDNPKPEMDPQLFKSIKTSRGPLGEKWVEEADCVMTCYKLVKVEFRWFGIQNRVEQWIQRAERNLFINFHRKVFCTIDIWHEMTIDDIRRLEEQTEEELNNTRNS